MIRTSSKQRCRREVTLGSSFNGPRRFSSYALLILGLIVLGTQGGCSVYHLAKRTLYCEMSEYPPVTDGKQSCKTYQCWAKEEWQRVQGESGEPFSNDYASGFLQGFVDQVSSGGEPIAPPVPPRKYWRVGYRSERGRLAIEQWYSGFEHGAQVGEEGGYRDRAVVPSSLYASSDPRSELRRDQPAEPTDSPPTEPTPADRPATLKLPVSSKPVKDDKAVEVADNAAEVAEEAVKLASVSDKPRSTSVNRQSTSGKPRSVIPVVFERPDSEPKQIHPTWGDKPPAPPWHTDALIEVNRGTKEASADEFDPYSGSIVAGPEDASRPKAATGDASDEEAKNTSDGSSSEAFSEKQQHDSTETLSDDDAAEQADAEQAEGWQSKHEPTKWKSRR